MFKGISNSEEIDMAIVWIPATMQELTKGKSKVIVEGTTVRAIINNLDNEFNGIKERLMNGNSFRGELNVFVDGAELGGNLLEKVGENSEVHFLPAIGGG